MIDDLGYVQQSREEMEVLFTLLAERYERGSVLVTSNLAFSQWEQIFKDPMTTAAAIDRLVHHSVIVELNVPSYRAEAAKRTRGGPPPKEDLTAVRGGRRPCPPRAAGGSPAAGGHWSTNLLRKGKPWANDEAPQADTQSGFLLVTNVADLLTASTTTRGGVRRPWWGPGSAPVAVAALRLPAPLRQAPPRQGLPRARGEF